MLQLVGYSAGFAACWGLGEALLRRRDPFLAAALGTAVALQGIFLLALLGLLRPLPVFGLFALAVISTVPIRRPTVGDLKDRLRRPEHLPSACILGAAAVPGLLLALYPSTGFDANVYHLPYAAAFAASGSLEFLPHLRFPVFPQHAEMGFAAGLIAGGNETGAHLTQVWAFLLTGGMIAGWARDRGLSRRTALWSTSLWLGTPLALWIGSSAYVDIALTLWITAGLRCFDGFRRTAELRWAALAGLFLGFAAATKYLGLFFLGIVGLWTLLLAARGSSVRGSLPRKTFLVRLRPALILGAAALLVAGPWYLRIYALTGNPLFPFYEPIFGPSEWTTFHDRTAFRDAERDDGVIRGQLERIVSGLGFLVTVPWRGVFDRAASFGGQAPLSPYYLLLLPLGLPFALARPWVRPWLGTILLYALFWLTTVRDLRFLLVVLPLLGLLLTAGCDRGWRVPPIGRRGTAIIAFLLLLPSLIYGAYKLWERGPLPLTEEQRTAYLESRLPAYGALLYLEREHGSDYSVYGLFSEHLRYHAAGTLLGDWSGPADYFEIQELFADPSALHRRLAELGVDYLLIRIFPRRPTVPQLPSSAFETVRSETGYRLFRLVADPQPLIFKDDFESGRFAGWNVEPRSSRAPGPQKRP